MVVAYMHSTLGLAYTEVRADTDCAPVERRSEIGSIYPGANLSSRDFITSLGGGILQIPDVVSHPYDS